MAPLSALAKPALRWTLLPLSTSAVLVLAVHRLWQRAKARRQAAEERQRAEAGQRIWEQLPAVEHTHAAAAATKSLSEATARFALGAERLAGTFQRAGAELQQAFAEFGALEELDEAVKPLRAQCTAWREVGEAKAVFASGMLDIAKSLRNVAEHSEAEAARCLAECVQLQRGLAVAEVDVLKAKHRPRGFVARLWTGGRTPQLDEEAEQQLRQGRWKATGAAVERLSAQLDAVRLQSSGLLNDAAAQARALAKDVGEKLVVLHPSPGKERRASSGRAGGISQKLGGLIKSMSTPEGRQSLRDAEAAEEAELAEVRPKATVEHMTAPPVEANAAGGWRIRGVLEYMVLKAGLRHLDGTWPADELLTFPRGKDGGPVLFRERLFGELLSGALRLQDITGNDVAAAQRDIDHLVLRQLLRLRVLHLDFTPSGCGADTVTAVGGTHEAFLGKLDRLLFRQLGQRALGGPSAGAAEGGTADLHRLGRQAVLMASAAVAVPLPPWWCWWISNHCRIFFNPARFESQGAFPVGGGVLEVTDLSKADRHEPTGQLRWFDWRVDLVHAEAELSSSPPGQSDAAEAAAGEAASTRLPAAAEEGGRSSQADLRKSTAAAGAATAAMISPELLHSVRFSLRRTHTLPES